MNIAEDTFETVEGDENLRIAVVMDVAVLKFVLRQLALSYLAMETARPTLTEKKGIERMDTEMKRIQAFIEHALMGIEEARRPMSGRVN